MKLIAELCQNHNGRVDILEEMVSKAKECGFTHVKIQGAYSEELTRREEFENPHGPLYRPFSREVERLQYLDLDAASEARFVDLAIESEITPMITVFTHKGVDRAQAAGFKSIKIASYDCASRPLIDRVSEFATEIVVSTGATAWREVEQTAIMLKKIQSRGIEVTLLHARTIYPTPSADIGLARMIALKDFGFFVGFSDHSEPETTGLLATKFAIILGADCIERHFTILPKDQTKDGKVSVNEEQAAELCSFARSTKRAQIQSIGGAFDELGTYVLSHGVEPTPVEVQNAKYYRGRFASSYNGEMRYSWEEL
jgi:N,N'-diacetyllegionaminate synthase